jgi:hypothetical protein
LINAQDSPPSVLDVELVEERPRRATGVLGIQHVLKTHKYYGFGSRRTLTVSEAISR